MPIDIAIGYDYISLVITGANTGGKTVSLHFLGLLSLAAANGLHNPANERSEIGLFEHVYDIGDGEHRAERSSLRTHEDPSCLLWTCCRQGDSMLFDRWVRHQKTRSRSTALAVAVISYTRQMGAWVLRHALPPS